MKILVMTENYFAGGMDTFIATLINNWPAADEFILVCNYAHPGLDSIRYRLRRNVKIIAHRCPTRPQIDGKLTAFPVFIKQMVRAFMICGQYILFAFYVIFFYLMAKKIGPDKVIVCNGGYPAGDTCRAMALSGLFRPQWGKPLFIYHNSPMPARFLKIIPEYSIDWLLEKSISFLVTVSDYTQRQLVNRPVLEKSKKKKVIYNGIEVPVEAGDIFSLRKELGIKEDASIVLMLGTYEARKGHDFLLRSFLRVREQIGDACLVMAGFGYEDDFKRINGLINKYALSDCAVLLKFRNDLAALLKEAQIMVIPSKEYESFGLTAVEAMSWKIPVVATNIGGIPEVIQADMGGFVVEKDEEAFSEKVILLLRDSALRKRMGEDGFRVYNEKFLASAMSGRYHALLNNYEHERQVSPIR